MRKFWINTSITWYLFQFICYLGLHLVSALCPPSCPLHSNSHPLVPIRCLTSSFPYFTLSAFYFWDFHSWSCFFSDICLPCSECFSFMVHVIFIENLKGSGFIMKHMGQIFAERVNHKRFSITPILKLVG